jgi:hypothetical protein
MKILKNGYCRGGNTAESTVLQRKQMADNCITDIPVRNDFLSTKD